ELLSRWQGQRDRGVEVPVAELCRDCPELAPQLQQRIDAVAGVQRLAAQSNETAASPSPPTPDHPAPAPPASEAMPAVTGYELLGVLGRGGMGGGDQARDTAPNRVGALKMILGGGDASGRPPGPVRCGARGRAP